MVGKKTGKQIGEIRKNPARWYVFGETNDNLKQG